MDVAERNEKVDVVKGLAAFTVVWGHVIQYIKGGVSLANDDIIYNVIYSFHMPLFMWLSGFTVMYSLNKKNIGIKDYIVKRARQLLLPFFSWGVVTSIYSSVGDMHSSNYLEILGRKLLDLLLTPENGLWFLWVLFWINVVHFALFRSKLNNKIILALLVVFWLIPIPNYCGSNNFKRMVPFYILGMYCQKKLIILDKKNMQKGVILFLGVLISVTVVALRGQFFIIDQQLVYNNYIFNLLNQIIKYVMALTWIFGIWYFIDYLSKGPIYQILSILGVYSLDIYAIQVFPTKMLIELAPYMDNMLILDVLVIPALAVLITFGCYLLSAHVFRRNMILSKMFLGK